jgi:4-amino-4-deoxy-L-arabinose transferase-like glycosyltransferase
MKTANWEKVLIVWALLIFLVLGCLWIEYPGLQYDETLFVFASYPRIPGSSHFQIDLFGRPFTVMLMPYMGGLKGWVYRVILHVAPGSAATLRLPVLLLGALTIFLLYRLTRRTLGAVTAVAAAWLTATDPTYLFTTRLDWGPVVIQRFCLVFGCFLIVRWHQEKQGRFAFAAFFIFGVALFDKISFHWLLVGLGVAALAVFPRELWQAIRGRALVLAVAGLMLGASPFLYYHRVQPAEKTSLGVSFETNPKKFLEKYWMLWRSLNGTVLQGWICKLSADQVADPPDAAARILYEWGDVRGRLAPSWFVPALMGACLLLPFSLRSRFGPAILFSLTFFVTAWVQMFVIEAGGSVHHVVLMYPFPQLFVAATVAFLHERIASRISLRAATSATIVIALLLVAGNVRSTAHQYAQILCYGSDAGWTDAIYPLSEYLKAQPAAQVVVIDWGIGTQLHFLSNNKMPQTGVPQVVEDTAEAGGRLEEWIDKPNILYVAYASDELRAFPKTQQLFRAMAASRGYELQLEKGFVDRNGRLIFHVYRLRGAGRESKPL